MMNRKLSTLMLAAAALLASCSQNDELQSTVNDNEGLKPVTISVAMPTEGMTTRATNASGDEEVTRCLPPKHTESCFGQTVEPTIILLQMVSTK